MSEIKSSSMINLTTTILRDDDDYARTVMVKNKEFLIIFQDIILHSYINQYVTLDRLIVN